LFLKMGVEITIGDSCHNRFRAGASEQHADPFLSRLAIGAGLGNDHPVSWRDPNDAGDKTGTGRTCAANLICFRIDCYD